MIKRDQMLMEIAHVVAQRSKCKRAQVGAVISLEGRVLSIGYNGSPSGQPDCCGQLNEPCTQSVHAEANAIAWAARKGVAIEGATLYVTMSPCHDCAKLISASGIVKVVYDEKYRLNEGTNYLQDLLEVEHYGSTKPI